MTKKSRALAGSSGETTLTRGSQHLRAASSKVSSYLNGVIPSPDFGKGSLAISFDFGPEKVTIANGLDENTLEFGQPHSHYRIYRPNS